MANETLLKCRFSDSGRGFGFAELLDGNGEDLFIAPDDTMNAMHGDTVLVHRFQPGERGYTRGNEGEITKIMERANTEILGTFTRVGAEGLVRPAQDKLNAMVYVRGADIGNAADGDKVAVRITDFPKRRGRDGLFQLTGYISAVFGPAETREANYAAILHANGIPTEFTDDALWEADDVATRSIVPDGRMDFRDQLTLTIDGADAKDLDDAISLSRTENGWLLGVHIADVSEYVKEGGAIDRDAYARGTSVYFVDKVIPMLPTALSNGCCSLNGGVDRYALSAFITLDDNGEMLSCDFKKTVIRSDVRGVYTEVNDIFANGRDSVYAQKYLSVLDMLFSMRELYGILKRSAERRGQLELESTEAYIVLDEKGLPTDILPRVRGDAECMIEQFMLAANIGAAKWLNSRNLPCLYRVHETPMPEKIRTFTLFAHNMGLDVSGIDDQVSSARLHRLLTEASDMGIAETVSGVLLRSLAKAKYSDKPRIHYGLGAELYCHFTSPIRRYPDLFVHRAISSILTGSRLPSHPAESARTTSDAEVRAVTAERGIEDLYMAQYCSFHIGEEYPAVISSVCSFGVFVRTNKLFEGLIPLEELFPRRTRGEYNEELMTLSGGGITYRLGMPMTVRIVRADAATGRIDLAPAGDSIPKVSAVSSPAFHTKPYAEKRSNNRGGHAKDNHRGGKPRNRHSAFKERKPSGRKKSAGKR